MSKIKVDCCGEICPIPLIETRKAIRKASPGDIIEIREKWGQASRLHILFFYFYFTFCEFVKPDPRNLPSVGKG